ncbi:MAG: MFS transporter [Gammaproteobacteria bacterium]
MAGNRIYYGWRMLPIFWFAYLAAAALPMYGGGVVNARMAEDLALSKATLGLGYTFYLTVGGLTAPLVGAMIHGAGLRRTIVSGAVLLTAAGVMMATVVDSATTYLVTFGLVAGLGSAMCGYIPSLTGATVWFERRRSLAIAIVITGAGVGGFVAPPILEAIIGGEGGRWQDGWGAMTACFLAAGSLALLIRNRPEDVGTVRDGAPGVAGAAGTRAAGVYRCSASLTLREATRTRAFWLIGASAMLAAAPLTGLIAHVVPHVRHIGFSAADAAGAMGALSLGSLAGRIGCGLIADRIEPRWLWVASMAIISAGIVALSDAAGPAALYLAAILVGLGAGALMVCQSAMIGNYFGADAFARVMGVVVPLTTLMSATSPLVTGWSFDRNGDYGIALAALTALSVASAALIATAAPPAFAERTQR